MIELILHTDSYLITLITVAYPKQKG